MSLGQLLVYPLRGQGGVLWVLCAVGLFVLSAFFEWTRIGDGQHLLAMVLLPIPWIITFAILQHYAWASLSHVAAGNDETIRSIAIEDVSPLNNFLAFKVAALLLGLAGLMAASFSTDAALGISVAVVVGVVLPAILGVIVLEEEFLAGLDARRLAAFVVGLGPAYPVFASLLYAGIAVLYAACLVISPPSIIAVLVAGYAFMLGHVLAGRVLYLCRDRLGLLTLLEKDPQHVAAVADTKAIEALMVELHRMCSVDRVDGANKLLEGFLEKDAFVHDERIHQRLETFQDKRLQARTQLALPEPAARCEQGVARMGAVARVARCRSAVPARQRRCRAYAGGSGARNRCEICRPAVERLRTRVCRQRTRG